MDADLDTLATALYVTTDDFLADNPQHRPWRPEVGLTPRITDAELVTLVVMQALLGFTSEARFLRYANTHLRGIFPYLPTQSGYNKRIRAATGMLRAVLAHLVGRCRGRATTCGWSTRPRSSVGARERRRNGRIWPGGPSTATALRIRASFGGCACTWCARCRVCRWRSRWPAPRPTNARSCSACSTPTRISWPPTRSRS